MSISKESNLILSIPDNEIKNLDVSEARRLRRAFVFQQFFKLLQRQGSQLANWIQAQYPERNH